MDNFQKQANLNLILSLNGASWNVSKATRDIIKVWKWSLQKNYLGSVCVVDSRQVETNHKADFEFVLQISRQEVIWAMTVLESWELEQFWDRGFRSW